MSKLQTVWLKYYFFSPLEQICWSIILFPFQDINKVPYFCFQKNPAIGNCLLTVPWALYCRKQWYSGVKILAPSQVGTTYTVTVGQLLYYWTSFYITSDSVIKVYCVILPTSTENCTGVPSKYLLSVINCIWLTTTYEEHTHTSFQIVLLNLVHFQKDGPTGLELFLLPHCTHLSPLTPKMGF